MDVCIGCLLHFHNPSMFALSRDLLDILLACFCSGVLVAFPIFSFVFVDTNEEQLAELARGKRKLVMFQALVMFSLLSVQVTYVMQLALREI